jgi:type I restriction enzyme S subunit
MSQASQVRTYDPAKSVVFLKTNERFGGLSNMAPGFPLRVNGVRIRTSEALYQACRFPHMPDVQRQIIDEHSPMTAKMRGKPFRKDSRSDWDAVRVKIMRWCLRVKLAQNWKEFGRLLLATGQRPIVEQSRKDDFWGAKVAEDGSLVGMNVLGRLLMELREQMKSGEADSLRAVEPLPIPEFLLFQKPIVTVCADEPSIRPVEIETRHTPATAPPQDRELPLPSLFDQQTIAHGQMGIQQNNRNIEADRGNDPAPYPSYKPARVHWLGEIPAHWQEKRGKYFFREIDERSVTGEEELLSISHTTGVTPRSQKNVTMFKAESYVGHKVAHPNDIVINTMWAWMSALGVSKHVGIVSPAYGVYRPLNRQDYLPEFVDYLLRTPLLKWEYICRSTGIRSSRLRLYPDKFLDIAFPCPPLVEQERMVAFLRAKEARFRRLIRNKRRLITLLNEQKQAIISKAITRGLDPSAPMKPSGIDWMPEIPAHWEAKRLKYLTRFQNGIAFKPSDWKDSGVPIIRIENLNGSDVFNYTDRTDLPEALLIQPGELVFAWSGNRGTSFGSFEWIRDFPAYLNQHIFKLEGYEQHRKYFFYLLRAVTKHVEDNAHGIIGLVHITKPALGALFVPLAPPKEQAAIADKIDEGLGELNQATDKIVAEIRLIGEYRERLIADIVTGKLDVRQIKIPAPADEPTVDDAEDLEEELEAEDADVMEEAEGDE